MVEGGIYTEEGEREKEGNTKEAMGAELGWRESAMGDGGREGGKEGGMGGRVGWEGRRDGGTEGRGGGRWVGRREGGR